MPVHRVSKDYHCAAQRALDVFASGDDIDLFPRPVPFIRACFFWSFFCFSPVVQGPELVSIAQGFGHWGHSPTV